MFCHFLEGEKFIYKAFPPKNAILHAKWHFWDYATTTFLNKMKSHYINAKCAFAHTAEAIKMQFIF